MSVKKPIKPSARARNESADLGHHYGEHGISNNIYMKIAKISCNGLAIDAYNDSCPEIKSCLNYP